MSAVEKRPANQLRSFEAKKKKKTTWIIDVVSTYCPSMPFCCCWVDPTILRSSYSLVNSRERVPKSLTRSWHAAMMASLGVTSPSVWTRSSNLGTKGWGTWARACQLYRSWRRRLVFIHVPCIQQRERGGSAKDGSEASYPKCGLPCWRWKWQMKGYLSK